MSYPDKKEQANQKWDQIDRPDQPVEEAKSSFTPSTEPAESVSDDLPVGKLKWSKDEEEEQDTNKSLGLDRTSLDDSGETSQRDVTRTDNETQPLSSTANADAEEEKSVTTSGHSSLDHQPNRTLSLEDTLTPIDFKEYSLNPEETTAEPTVEYKKPAFTIDFSDEIAEADQEENKAEFFTEKGSEEREVGKDIREEAFDGEETGTSAWKKALKILWLPVSLVVVLIVGLIVGHTVIGKQPAGEVFDMSMWDHIYQLLFSK